jgi:hypothetical protein
MQNFRRYLRIVFSGTCVIACVFLCVLWVRSCWRIEGTSFWIIGQGRGGAVSVKQHVIASFMSESSPALRYLLRTGADTRNPTLVNETIEQSFPGNTDAEIAGQLGLPKPPGFSFRQPNDSVYQLVVPHWCPVLLLAVFAALPWLRWSMRFSLRTLLIVTTFVAAVLGLIVWLVR